MEPSKETLIKSEFPTVQGCTVKINDCMSLILRANQKSHFWFACSDKSRMDLFRASLSTIPGDGGTGVGKRPEQ
jgi:hypothetical protein